MSLLDILSLLQKEKISSDILNPPPMSTTTAGLINTSGNIAIVGSTQTSACRTSDNYLETTIEPRIINGRLKG